MSTVYKKYTCFALLCVCDADEGRRRRRRGGGNSSLGTLGFSSHSAFDQICPKILRAYLQLGWTNHPLWKSWLANNFKGWKTFKWNHISLQCEEVGLLLVTVSNGRSQNTGLHPFPRPVGFPGPRYVWKPDGTSVQRLVLSRADCASIPNYFLIVEIKPKWET